MDYLKKGKDWAACYDSGNGRYLGRLGYASTQGSECFIYVLSPSAFNRLGTFDRQFANNELIRDEGTLIFKYENTRYGTMSPESTEYEKGAEESWERAYQRSLDRLEASAEAGDLLALRTWLGLNRHTYLEKDQKKKQQKIRHFLVKAAENGLRSAQEELAGLYCFGEHSEIEIDVDLKKAVYWSIQYLENENVIEPEDPAILYQEAFHSYQMGTTSWTPDNQCYEGWRYLSGTGVKQCFEKAVYWFVKGTVGGNSDAQNNLGLCFEHGLGVEQDNEKAMYWYAKAAEQGNEYGKNNLKKLKDELGR